MRCCRKARTAEIKTAGEQVTVRYIGKARGYLTFNCPGKPRLHPTARQNTFVVDRGWAACLLQTGLFEEVL